MIRVNGKWDIAWQQGMTMRQIFQALGFTHHYVAVSVNGTLIPFDDQGDRPISDGDQVEIIHIIGGG